MLSSWSEIYSRIKFFKKVQKPYMQLGLLMSEKCGIFIANSICIQYVDLQILDSLPKSLLSKLADSLHFLMNQKEPADEQETKQSASQKFQITDLHCAQCSAS